MSTVTSPIDAPRRRLPMLAAVLLLLVAAPLMSGCLERSTTVGDRYSGTIVVATSPDNPHGAPKLDLPESMASLVSVTEYRATPTPSTTPGGPGPSGSTSTTTTPRTPGNADDDRATHVGTRATFSGLTSGQLSQLGDIVADSFGDTSVTMDLTAKRSGEVVRFRGSTDLTDLAPQRDYVQLTLTFAGPITATNGDQTGESSVTWTPEPGKPSDFSADATYPDPATAAVSSWSWFLAAICLIVVAVIVAIAYSSRHRGPRPGRPVRAKIPSTAKSDAKSKPDAKSASDRATQDASKS